MRAVPYLLTLVGAAVGYVGSYWAQAGLLRAAVPLGKYVTEVHETLTKLGMSTNDGEIAKTVLMCTFGGAVLGVIAGYVMVKNKSQVSHSRSKDIVRPEWLSFKLGVMKWPLIIAVVVTVALVVLEKVV